LAFKTHKTSQYATTVPQANLPFAGIEIGFWKLIFSIILFDISPDFVDKCKLSLFLSAQIPKLKNKVLDF
jgi:hypothetical protein